MGMTPIPGNGGMSGGLQRVQSMIKSLLPKGSGQSGSSESQFNKGNKPNLKDHPKAEQVEKLVVEWFDEVKETFSSYHQMAWEAILFYAGQTWIKWSSQRKVYEPETPSDDWVPTPRINRFAPTIDSVVANFNTVPQIEATPREIDSDPMVWGVSDIASRLADDWMSKVGLRGDSMDDEEDKVGTAAQAFVLMGGVLTEVVPCKPKSLGQLPVEDYQDSMGATCGNCDYYDNDAAPTGVDDQGNEQYNCPDCGNPMTTSPSRQSSPRLNPDGSPVMEEKYQVDAECKIVLPIFIIPRPGARGVFDSPYLFWAERVFTDKIFFDFEGTEIQPDAESLDGFETGFKHELNYFYQGISQLSQTKKDSALVIRCYIPPNKVKDCPEGALVTFTKDNVFSIEKWDFDSHPLTYAPYQRIPTLFMGRSSAFELTGIQKEYQSYESLIKLHGMTSAVDSIIVDENTVVTQITGRSDKVIKWRSIGPGSKEPHRMQHGTLDEGIYKQRQSLRDEFENASGAVGVYKGQQPGSITAGSAIDKLRGQAEMIFTKPVLNWQSLWLATVRKAVKIRQKMWTLDEIAEIVGVDKMVHINNFKRADLDKVIKYVSTAHGLPRSREERKMELMTLWDRQAIDLSEPSVRETIFELFGETGLMNNFNLDATRARIENQKMKRGIQVQLMPEIEDMGVHLGCHLQVAKSMDFDLWPPNAQQLMLQHIMQTQLAQEQKQMRMAMMQGGPGGGDKDKGKPPGDKGHGNQGQPPTSTGHPTPPGPAAPHNPNPNQPVPAQSLSPSLAPGQGPSPVIGGAK